MKFWRRKEPRVSREEVKVTFAEVLKEATAKASPEDRKSLMDIQVVSRSSEETDAEWRERTKGLLKHLYEEE